MALDEPKDDDKKFELESYTVVMDPYTARVAGDELRIEYHKWGGFYVIAGDGNGGW